MPEKFVALVPVKAISERVPGKNMRGFNGRPLLHYILDTLEKTPEIFIISINTDSPEAAEYAQRFSKVVIHERPPELRGNDVPMNRIIADELSRLEGDYFLQTHATNPLLTSATVSEAIKTFLNLRDNDSLFSVLPCQSRFYDQNGIAVNHDPRNLINTQDLPPLYEENSCLYVFTRDSFNRGGQNRLGVNPALFSMSRIESQDIDTEEDFILAELLWKSLQPGMKKQAG